MKEFCTEKYIIRLMNHSDQEEVKTVQKLRYDFLLKEYNPSLVDGGTDDDGYDKYTDSIIVIDKEKNFICGTYRIATNETLKNHPFLTEEEYNISTLKENCAKILELGRAVVHKDYRNGSVVQLLFLAIYRYMVEHDCKYTMGLSSFHGSNPLIYKNAFTYLVKNHQFTEYKIKAIKNSFSLDLVDGEISKELLEEELPGLLKMYLRFGNKVCCEGSIDYDFNSCDVLIILNRDEVNTRYISHFSKSVKE